MCTEISQAALNLIMKLATVDNLQILLYFTFRHIIVKLHAVNIISFFFTSTLCEMFHLVILLYNNAPIPNKYIIKIY